MPEFSDKFRSNFVEGAILIDAEKAVDNSGIGTSIALELNICVTRLWQRIIGRLDINADQDYTGFSTADQGLPLSRRSQISRSSLLVATDPISRPTEMSLQFQKGPYISSFDSPTSVIVEDLAPYLRSIVFYDIKLEEQRLHLDSLYQGGRNGRRMRTTRASRAALEGGSKSSTRREKWFPPNTDFTLILQTGGEGWQELAWQRALDQSCKEFEEDSPRRCSLESVTSTDTQL